MILPTIKRAVEEIWSGQHKVSLRFGESWHSILTLPTERYSLGICCHEMHWNHLSLSISHCLKALWFPKIHCLVCFRSPRSNSSLMYIFRQLKPKLPWRTKVREDKRQVLVLHNLAGHLTEQGRGNTTMADNIPTLLLENVCTGRWGNCYLYLVPHWFRFKTRKLHIISLKFCKMLQQIAQSVTLPDHSLFKCLLTSFESLSLLNSCLTQLHLRNKETTDPSSLAQIPLKQNKTSPLQLPFSITLTLCRGRKRRMHQWEASHTPLHALDIWHRSRCLPRDYCTASLGEPGGQGAASVYTHPATCTSFLLGLYACTRTPGTDYLYLLAKGNK